MQIATSITQRAAVLALAMLALLPNMSARAAEPTTDHKTTGTAENSHGVPAPWGLDWAAALKHASEGKKPVVAMFSTSWCPPCSARWRRTAAPPACACRRRTCPSPRCAR